MKKKDIIILGVSILLMGFVLLLLERRIIRSDTSKLLALAGAGVSISMGLFVLVVQPGVDENELKYNKINNS